MTFIDGSNAIGEALPPHFQVSTKATEKRERVRIKMVTYFHNMKEKFGYHREKTWPTTIWLNLNRVMDDDEFEKFILNSIVPLYPDKEDIKK